MLTHGSLFSGIGGFDLGFERVGIKTLWQVECDPYCLKVLEKHWSDVRRIRDIAHAQEDASLETPTIITGGFPCQPVSLAGQRRAQQDARWLWPAMRSIIARLRPSYVVVENVPGLFSAGYDEVCADMESEAYTVGTLMVPACAFGHPHLRNRIWILAHTESIRVSERGVARRRAAARQSMPQGLVSFGNWQEAANQLCRVDDGLSPWSHRGKALGNAIVPAIAEKIGCIIIAVEIMNV